MFLAALYPKDLIDIIATDLDDAAVRADTCLQDPSIAEDLNTFFLKGLPER